MIVSIANKIYGQISMTLITKKETTLLKDQLTSVLLQSATYEVKHLIDNVVVTAGAFVYLPDVVESDLSKYTTHKEVLHSLISVIDQISIRRYDLMHCPNCKKSIFHFKDELHVVCSNINCIMSEDLEESLRLKMIALFPMVPINFLIEAIQYVMMYCTQPTVYSVIKFLVELYHSDILHPLNLEHLASFKEKIRTISIAKLFHAIVGKPFSEQINEIITYYNDDLQLLMNDYPATFEPLFFQKINHELRIFLIHIINSNRELIQYILKA